MLEEDEEFQAMSRKLGKYGMSCIYSVRNKQQNQLLQLDQSGSKKQCSKTAAGMKNIYIERKYNTKLAFQMHTIMQAKKIEDDRERIKKELSQTYQAPLIRNTMKVVFNQK